MVPRVWRRRGNSKVALRAPFPCRARRCGTVIAYTVPSSKLSTRHVQHRRHCRPVRQCSHHPGHQHPRRGPGGIRPDLSQSGLFEGLNTGLQLWWLAHECAHHVIGPDETAADCWSIRQGRDEGWFPPEMFYWMEQMFADNRGDSEHPPGPQRVRDMQRCYYS